MLLETPKDDGLERRRSVRATLEIDPYDAINLATLRSLYRPAYHELGVALGEAEVDGKLHEVLVHASDGQIVPLWPVEHGDARFVVINAGTGGKVRLFPRREMLDVVVVNGQARGIIARNLVTGETERHEGHAVVLCTGGYGNVYFLSTNAKGSNVSATYRAYKRGAFFANPCFTQIHPTCIPVSSQHQSKLTLMSESLRNDGRVWVPKTKGDTRKYMHLRYVVPWQGTVEIKQCVHCVCKAAGARNQS